MEFKYTNLFKGFNLEIYMTDFKESIENMLSLVSDLSGDANIDMSRYSSVEGLGLMDMTTGAMFLPKNYGYENLNLGTVATVIDKEIDKESLEKAVLNLGYKVRQRGSSVTTYSLSQPLDDLPNSISIDNDGGIGNCALYTKNRKKVLLPLKALLLSIRNYSIT